MKQSGIPCEQHDDGPTIEKINAERVLRAAHVVDPFTRMYVRILHTTSYSSSDDYSFDSKSKSKSKAWYPVNHAP
jgi:hypothetical protein